MFICLEQADWSAYSVASTVVSGFIYSPLTSDYWWKGQSSPHPLLPKFLPFLLYLIFAVIPLWCESAHLSKANLPFVGRLRLCGYNFPCSSHVLWKSGNSTFMETYWTSPKVQSEDFVWWECDNFLFFVFKKFAHFQEWSGHVADTGISAH